jgi:hypothetical protein
LETACGSGEQEVALGAVPPKPTEIVDHLLPAEPLISMKKLRTDW